MTLKRFAVDAGSFVLWIAGWLTVGYDRPVRVVVAMLMVMGSSRLIDRGIKLWLAELERPS